MPSARTAALLVLLAAGSAAPALAEDRCTGTLCDLYYGGPPPEPAPGQASTAPRPLTVPSMPTVSGGGILGKLFGKGDAPSADTSAQAALATQAAPAKRPLVAVQGGGLAGPAAQPGEHCTGTLCDFYYGTSTPWPDEAKPAAAPVASATAAEDVADAPPPRRAAAGVRYETPRCASAKSDPWHCYR